MSTTKSATGMNIGYARPIAAALLRPPLGAAALRFAVETLRSFFGPQFENSLTRRRKVVNVDHPLDGTIPFDASRVGKYGEFVKLFLESLYYLLKRSRPRELGLFIGYANAIRGLYLDAGSVYKTVHTTTTRPSKNYNMGFAIIHAFDPHLNCVPSLHVLVVTANWKFAGGVAAEMGKESEFAPWIESLRREALAITESVLFVKQHSVNCIGASLYYLRRRTPGLSEAEIEAFVADLFAADEAEGRLPSAPALRARMLEVYRDLDLSYAARPEAGWRQPILDFILSFPSA
jgi:hypothetical protein